MRRLDLTMNSSGGARSSASEWLDENWLTWSDGMVDWCEAEAGWAVGGLASELDLTFMGGAGPHAADVGGGGGGATMRQMQWRDGGGGSMRAVGSFRSGGVGRDGTFDFGLVTGMRFHRDDAPVSSGGGHV